MSCLIFLSFSLLLDGSMYRLWKLNQQFSFFQQELKSLELKEQQLAKDLQNVKNPAFMKRLAQERLDLTDKGDLIFVFTE
ncbi:MAG: septum formation initiator family protein [Bdellovibrionales bacterium]|nr:septum formation initiator family protein [Bdellovibrionales bacterium]